MAALQISSSAFLPLARAQARALGCADLGIAVIPHPFGSQSRATVREIAARCLGDIVKLATEPPSELQSEGNAAKRLDRIEVADDVDAVNALFRERRWTDGLPIVPPTATRVERMLGCTPRAAGDVIALVAPGFGEATVERIAVNAVMAGCDPEYLPVLIAAVEAISHPGFNLQGIEASTNPAGLLLIVNGPIVQRLDMNAGINCMGHGNWANATLGRALRLIVQNIGKVLPGEMDRATHGQPAKYTFCCPENEAQSPWEPLHVERGFKAGQSAVTVVAAEGMVNMNSHTKDAGELVRAIAETLPRPPSNDYWIGGEPWIVVSPEHAEILARGGYTKAELKRALWETSKMPAQRMTPIDFERTRIGRRPELGDITRDTLLPICASPERLGILVAGGPGTHSVYIPGFGCSESATREIVWSA